MADREDPAGSGVICVLNCVGGAAARCGAACHGAAELLFLVTVTLG